MTDLERFFRLLVHTIATTDESRLTAPIPVAEIAQLVPYRTFRRALQLETSEDYELVILRLAAGEGGFARAEPAAARGRFQAELASPHPDLAVLDEGGGAELMLSADRIALAREPEADRDRLYAPPITDASPPAPPESEPATAAVAVAVDADDDALPLDAVRAAHPQPAPPPPHDVEQEEITAGAHCSYCGGGLPEGRAVNYCPHCGQSQAVTHCPECRSEVEIGWRHCITCGYALGG